MHRAIRGRCRRVPRGHPSRRFDGEECDAAAIGLTIGIGGLAAQGDDEFGAGIFEGACASPGDRRLFDPGDLEIDDDDDDERRRTPTIGGTLVAGPVSEEDEDLSATIDDLT